MNMRTGLITLGAGGALLLAWLWLRPPPPPSDGLLQLPGNVGTLPAPEAPGTTPPVPVPATASPTTAGPATTTPASGTPSGVVPPTPPGATSPGGVYHPPTPAEIASMNIRSKEMTAKLLDHTILSLEEEVRAANAAGNREEAEVKRVRIENLRQSKARVLAERDALLKEQERLPKSP